MWYLTTRGALATLMLLSYARNRKEPDWTPHNLILMTPLFLPIIPELSTAAIMLRRARGQRS